MRSFVANNKGFTLVELLIVVAIIGVLSTIGIPTFRSMVQKAKKSEAKVALGGLYTAEAAFFAEYGGYGNNLTHVGFDLEGQGRIYSVGFPNATGACANRGTAHPIAASGPGRVIRQVVSGYDTSPITVIGADPTLANSQCFSGDVNDTGNQFTATAAGIISAAAKDINFADIWNMNHERRLFNCQDGVGRSSGTAACPAAPTGGGTSPPPTPPTP
ncbi:MAG: prepilin-type N-terminal cleavage/methylation domain-containing protein [Bdellovibrionales bacterium]|nr:prepilin-type N-terminal cleavage/methylation domain-containing protein [Bdellovibrionales bacterium]